MVLCLDVWSGRLFMGGILQGGVKIGRVLFLGLRIRLRRVIWICFTSGTRTYDKQFINLSILCTDILQYNSFLDNTQSPYVYKHKTVINDEEDPDSGQRYDYVTTDLHQER